ncbi:hypothetical protein CP533_4126 [Ophiocordyceps camponoti-saundersi (nom. inval.)]|nr:hypothetical protein CP533_4126 [Ophiocordyceps camponoti-saundersi (nom. inval.)]
MYATRRLLQGCRITLFSRPNCGLCDEAAEALSEVAKRRPFAYTTVDVLNRESRPWRKLYGFDVPVIHISKASAQPEEPLEAAEAVKLMHRFTPAEIEAKMDQVEAS